MAEETDGKSIQVRRFDRRVGTVLELTVPEAHGECPDQLRRDWRMYDPYQPINGSPASDWLSTGTVLPLCPLPRHECRAFSEQEMIENNRIMQCETIEANIITSKSKGRIPVLARVVMAAAVAGAGVLGTAHADVAADMTQAVASASEHVLPVGPMADSRKTSGSCAVSPESLRKNWHPTGLCGVFSGPIENTSRADAYVVAMGNPIVNERRGGSY